VQLRERLRDIEIQGSRRWCDPDGRRTCCPIRVWRDTLSENAASMVLTESPAQFP